MSEPTLADLLPYLGKTATWQTADGVRLRGTIKDGRVSWGRDEFLIELQDGQRVWKQAGNVTVEGE